MGECNSTAGDSPGFAWLFGLSLGSFAAIALSRVLARRPMFVTYFLYSAAMLFATFGLDLAPPARASATTSAA
jgi:hypothetical protein